MIIRQDVQQTSIVRTIMWCLNGSDQLRNRNCRKIFFGVGVIERDFFPRFRYNIHMLWFLLRNKFYQWYNKKEIRLREKKSKERNLSTKERVHFFLIRSFIYHTEYQHWICNRYCLIKKNRNSSESESESKSATPLITNTHSGKDAKTQWRIIALLYVLKLMNDSNRFHWNQR